MISPLLYRLVYKVETLYAVPSSQEQIILESFACPVTFYTNSRSDVWLIILMSQFSPEAPEAAPEHLLPQFTMGVLLLTTFEEINIIMLRFTGYYYIFIMLVLQALQRYNNIQLP